MKINEDKKLNFNKKKMIIFIVIILFIIISFFFINKLQTRNYQKFNKYAINIIIDLVDQNNKNDRVVYNLKYDGKNALVNNFGYFTEQVFILPRGNLYRFVYKKDQKYLIYDSEYSLVNLYANLEKVKIKKRLYKSEEKEIYDVMIEKNVINEIFTNLFLDFKVDESYSGTIIIENDFITSYDFIIKNNDKYKLINFSFNVQKLSEDYKIDIPTLERDVREEIDKNIFDVFN